MKQYVYIELVVDVKILRGLIEPRYSRCEDVNQLNP